MANNPHEATLFEKLAIVPGVFLLLGSGLYAAVAAPYRGDWGADSFKHHVLNSMLRKMIETFNTAQLQYLTPAFMATYEQWCKKNEIEPAPVTLKSGCKCFWVGDKKADYVIINYHGGGYSLDASENYLMYYDGIRKNLESVGKSVAFFFVEYTLVPYATFPGQLVQGVEAVQYILDQGRRPSEIILTGDSAGGNMCLAVLSHLSHPLAGVPELKIESPLKAIVVMAPWVKFELSGFGSAARNRYKDILAPAASTRWGRDYLGGKPANPYAEALEAPASWWKDVKVEQLLAVAGGDEILIDAINEWVEKYKSVNPDSTTYVVGGKETHIAPILEVSALGVSGTQQGQAILSFLKARL